MEKLQNLQPLNAGFTISSLIFVRSMTVGQELGEQLIHYGPSGP
jgi:hypothetical protein